MSQERPFPFNYGARESDVEEYGPEIRKIVQGRFRREQEEEWRQQAIDKAGFMFEPEMNDEGNQIGFRLVPKPPPASPQDLGDMM